LLEDRKKTEAILKVIAAVDGVSAFLSEAWNERMANTKSEA
jgi:hypothetical protein